MDYEELREELIELAQTKQIRQKVEKIREATNEQLERIKDNYEVKKVKVAAKQLQTMVTKSFIKALHGAGVLEDEKLLQKDLDDNKLLEENVVKLTAQLGGDNPYLELAIAGVTILSYVGYNVYRKLFSKDKPSPLQTNSKTPELRKDDTPEEE